jgi:RNA polymerase sigma-70 factor (ECF subfamily)
MSTIAGVTSGAFASRPTSLDVVSDERLADGATPEGFAELYERHFHAVYRYVAGRVAAREEAEDVTSDIFREAWTSRRKYRGRGAFRAWLFTIVRRVLADHYRYRGPSFTRLEPTLGDGVLDAAPTPEDHVVRDERAALARSLVADLSREQQEVLSLRFAAELSYAEIGAVIGKREDAVKKIAYRALETLREKNAEQGDDDHPHAS